MAIAVGDHYFGKVPQVLLRASGPLAGGGGSCYEEMCGILSGGMMMLGALLGRTLPTENDEQIFQLAREYRDRFLALAKHTQCQAIRDTLPEKEKRCEPLVVSAVLILLEMLDAQAIRPAQ